MVFYFIPQRIRLLIIVGLLLPAIKQVAAVLAFVTGTAQRKLPLGLSNLHRAVQSK
jgi:hypothetical protein